MRPLFRICAVSVFGLWAGSGYAQIELSTGAVLLQFNGTNGGLERLLDVSSNTELIETPFGQTGTLWQIDFIPGTRRANLSPSDALSFRFERTPGKGVFLTWDEFDAPGAERVRVHVTVAPGAQASTTLWRIDISNPGALPIEKVRFPRLVHIREQRDERLAVPVWMGELTRDPRNAICRRAGPACRLEWPYPGLLSLQCLALYSEEGAGLYLSSDDAAAFRKSFAFFGNPDGKIGYEMIHLPENSRPAATRYAPSYAAVVGTFHGDWLTAAERYRDWGTKQDWATRSRLNLGHVPDWLLKTGLWVWNRGRSEQVLKPAGALMKTLGLPVSVFWHWWHGCAYDIGFPEYLPPREGTEPFRQAVREASAEGLNAIVYMNQRLWGMTTRSWKEKGAERYAVKGVDGVVRPEVYNTYTGQACASMCMGTSFWRNHYAGIAEEVVRCLGVSGIYMDQACSSLVCYDPSHGHPLGGGTFWMRGFRELSDAIRARTAAIRDVLLAGEGSGEAWLPYLDLMLTLQVSRERYAAPDGWEVIPFFQAVYHDCGVTYGNYSALTVPPYDELWPAEYAPADPLKLLDRRYASQFYLEQARTFVWGIQPTISNFLPLHLRERPVETAYLLRLARVRYEGLKYLLYGKFLRAPQINVPDKTVEISRLSIYAGRKGVQVPTAAPLTHASTRSPGVLAGAWRARDGSTGIALASILNRPVSFHVDLKPYGIAPADRVFIIDERARKPVDRDGSSVKVTLAPLGACIVELPPISQPGH